MEMTPNVEISVIQSFVNAVKLDNYMKSRCYGNLGQAVEALFQKCHISLCLSSGHVKNNTISISGEVKLLMDSVSHRLGLSSREHMLDFLVASRDIFGDEANLDLSSWHSLLNSLKTAAVKVDQKPSNKREFSDECDESSTKDAKCLKTGESKVLKSENYTDAVPIPYNIVPIKEEKLGASQDKVNPGHSQEIGANKSKSFKRIHSEESAIVLDSDDEEETNVCKIHGKLGGRSPLALLDANIPREPKAKDNIMMPVNSEKEEPQTAGKLRQSRTFREPLSDESIAQLDGSRFPEPVSDEVIDEMQQKKYAKATERKLKWMLKLYNEWRENRNKIPNVEPITADLTDIENLTKEDLCYAMKRFIVEARKESGEDYPGTTLNDLLFCAQCHLYKNGLRWRLMDEKEFFGLKTTLENEMKKRSEMVEVQGRDTISESLEELMWHNGVLGESNPEQLQDTVLYLMALHLGVKSGTDHKALRRPGFNSQFHLVSIENQITYLKYTPEKPNGKSGPKEVVLYPSVNQTRCPVRLFAKYVSLLPPNGKVADFYLRPQMLRDKGLFYRDIAVGINKLSSTVRRMCLKAGLLGNFNNGSVRNVSG